MSSTICGGSIRLAVFARSRQRPRPKAPLQCATSRALSSRWRPLLPGHSCGCHMATTNASSKGFAWSCALSAARFASASSGSAYPSSSFLITRSAACLSRT
eukprot:Amastigsp_a2134_17.p3 type:complete len:101 gc:universal Amastigsp_a2134_17:112-414(+)